MNGQRKAMIIANGEYDQEALRDLLAPAADAEALGRVLGDPQIGDFAVQVVRNEPAHVIQAQIEELFSESRPDDVLLVHFSGHGLKSESGELFFAASNTRPNRLGSTAVSAEFVQRCMQAGRSRHVVLLLDCCYGGAFAQGVRVRAAGDIHVLDSFPSDTRSGGGRGRAVITASRAMEFAFEGDKLGDNQHRRPSVFTAALVEGLATGDADRDEDGWVSLNELYDYVFDRVREQNPHQTPSRQVELEGELYLARSRRQRIRPAPLPPDLQAAMTDPNMYTRRGAVSELRSRLLSDNLPAAAGAWEALTELANDTKYVADEARAALHEADVHPAETELHFGRIAEGSPPPHRTIRLLGPPIARACRPNASHEWISIEETAEGFDISVDTAQAGTLNGRLNIKGPTGEAAVTIQADLIPVSPETLISEQATNAIPASTPALSHAPETPPWWAPRASPPKSAALMEPAVPSPRPLVTGPADPTPVPKPGRGIRILSVFWALLPTLSFGALTPFLAPVPFAHAAVRLHDRKLWLISAVYGLVSLPLWILWIVAVNKQWASAATFWAISFAIGLVATIHAFQLRRRVFARSSLPTAAEPGPSNAIPESDEGTA